ncbi:MAG: chromosome segregation protein SMC [Nanobdellota archaeon]
MTHIQKLVMNGFKSFSHRTELVLGTKFNCVLGPNGSGKSNVMDALCFVLGKGSAKGLRAEKAANLIYNGGKTKQPAKQGEVSIVFDNSDGTFPTEEKSVTITRIVKSSGQSIYKINEQTRTRQQILELLSMARINPDGYNIILQGDIVRFVEMSPDERRKIIEEISGISVYEEKKRKAENELDKVEKKLEEAQIVLNERKNRLDELKSERDQALKYKETQEKLKKNKASLLDKQIKEKEEKLSKIEENINKFKEQMNRNREEIEELKKEAEEKKKEESQINNEIENKGEEEKVRLHKEVEQLKIDIAKNQTKTDNLKNEVEKAGERKKQMQDNLEETRKKIEALKKEKEELLEGKRRKEEQLKSVEDNINKYKEDNDLDNASDIEKDIDKVDKEIEEKQQETHDLRERQQELMRRKDKLELQIQSTDEKINKVKEVEKEYEKEMKDLKSKKEELKKSTSELSKELDKNQSIVAETTNARKELERIQEELSGLNAKNNSIKQAAAGSMAIQKILENKDRFGNVYGTVSDLGSVKSKYSQALEVAAGPRMKSIVVENDKVASECIKFLKDNKLGSATFLPLNKIKPVKESESAKKLLKANGVHGLAKDLVEYDPRFKKIFSHVFGNTIVVEDIDTARRLGIGENRMTTLTGDIVESSGAMQGGFRSKKTGVGFKENEIVDKIKELENKEADQKKLLSNLESKREDNEEKIKRLREHKANLEGETIKKEKSLHLESSDLEASKKAKEDFSKELKEVDKELEDVQKKVSGKNQELAKKKTEKQQLKDKINEIRNPKKLAELNAFQQKKDEIKEEISKYDLDIKNCDERKSTILDPELKKSEDILKQHQKEEEDFNKQLQEMNEYIKKQQEELKEKEKKEEEFRKQFKVLFDKRNKVQEKLREINDKISRKEQNIREIETKSNNYSLDNAKLKAELNALKEEFKEYEGTELIDNNKETMRENIKKFEAILSDMGNVNMKALEIYENVEKEYNELVDKKERLGQEKQDVLEMMNEIETKKKELFTKAFNNTNESFKNIFKQLSTKGEAYMELENEQSPLDGGVTIKVKMSSRKYLDIRSLSGGEKTLTALSFIFALQEHDPATFYIFDEVDAALDKKNSEKLAELIRKYSENAQYLIISHNDAVISEANHLYGVSMNEHGMSKIVSLKV